MSDIRKDCDSKLWVYSQIKSKYNYEFYLDAKQSERNLVTKFRLSAHWLPIERLRYTKPKIERKSRLCTLCHKGLGNEYHALMECDDRILFNMREIFMKEISTVSLEFRHMDKINQFWHIISAQEGVILPHVIKWISQINDEYKKKV